MNSRGRNVSLLTFAHLDSEIERDYNGLVVRKFTAPSRRSPCTNTKSRPTDPKCARANLQAGGKYEHQGFSAHYRSRSPISLYSRSGSEPAHSALAAGQPRL